VLVEDGVAAVRGRRFTCRVRFLAPLAILAASVFVGFLLLRGEDERPGAIAIDRYLAAWTRGADDAAAALTDNPKAAAAALKASRTGLDGASVRTSVSSRAEDAARVRVTWQVPGFGRFAYSIRLAAVEGEAGWRVRWRETLVHPELDRQTRLGTAVDRPRRGPAEMQLLGDRDEVAQVPEQIHDRNDDG